MHNNIKYIKLICNIVEVYTRTKDDC